MMGLVLLAAIALPGFGPPSPVHTVRHTEGPWTLVLSRNQFTGQVACRLRGRAMEVEGNALILQFGRAVDTSRAWFRIGSDDPRPWRRLIPELRQTGVRLRFDDLENPSQGRVAIPLRILADEASIWIAPEEKSRPRRFVISGLTDALERANAQGCALGVPENAPNPATAAPTQRK